MNSQYIIAIVRNVTCHSMYLLTFAYILTKNVWILLCVCIAPIRKTFENVFVGTSFSFYLSKSLKNNDVHNGTFLAYIRTRKKTIFLFEKLIFLNEF